jgi:Cys-tRNA(Pro)/Cys-tRNA(Cys) deacylase
VTTKKGATPAITQLDRLGIGYRVHEYAHDPSETAFGDEAARSLGDVEPDRVFKTLVVSIADELVVAVVPVPTTLDLKALAAEVGAKRADLADPKAAERSSGYVVGAISPIGQKRRLRTLVDESALAFETVFCSAGRRGLEVELAPTDLVRATTAQVAAIARR